MAGLAPECARPPTAALRTIAEYEAAVAAMISASALRSSTTRWVADPPKRSASRPPSGDARAPASANAVTTNPRLERDKSNSLTRNLASTATDGATIVDAVSVPISTTVRPTRGSLGAGTTGPFIFSPVRLTSISMTRYKRQSIAAPVLSSCSRRA